MRSALALVGAVFLAALSQSYGSVGMGSAYAIPDVAGTLPAMNLDSGLSIDASQALSAARPSGSAVLASADYAPAYWVPAAATNYSVFDRPIDYPVDMIVIHDIEGSAGSALETFQDPTRHGSAHYIVSFRGTVWQMVLEKDVAWHAGNWDYNSRSIGIEHEGYAWTPGLYTPTEYRASAHLAAAICSRWGVPMDRAHVIGHSQVPDPFHKGLYGGDSHHTDPGPYWNWTYYIAYARYYASLLPSPPHMQRAPVAVPDDGSASVRWVPTPTCHTPISSYHLVLQPGNVIQDLPGNATTATFGGLQNGTSYSITVTAINPDGQSTMQSNSVIAGPHCTTADLTSSLASPQLLGTQLQFSAASAGCPNPMYQFFVQHPNGGWETGKRFGGDSWTWDTALYLLGTYKVRVWANQSGDSSGAEAFADFTITLTEPPPCTSAALSPSKPSQPAGSIVNFTASATGCPVPLYEYWIQYPSGKWVMLQSFSANAAWSWNTWGLQPAKYTIRVWANHPGHSKQSYEVFATSTVTLTGCISAAVSPALGSATVWTPVTFTASAIGCPSPVYEFWVQDTAGKWHRMTGFGGDTWTWNHVGWAKGVYHIRVWVNQQGAYMGTYETYGSSTRTLT
jgi:hypothetical protein